MVPFTAVMSLMGAAYLWVSWRVARDRGDSAGGLFLILAFAALFYLTLLPGPPLFDDDLWRYLWDGKVTLAGINPFNHAPSDPALAALRDADHRRIGYPNLPTPYPPAAQLLFAGLRVFSGGAPLAAKACLGLFFALSLALVVSLLRQTGQDGRLVILWAWNPTVLKEFANSGHIDLAAIALLLASVWLLLRGKHAWSGATLAAASLTKLFPLFAAPFLFWRSRRKGLMLLSFVLALVLFCLPFISAGPAILGSLGAYLRYWLYNHGFFELWESAWKLGGLGPAVARGAFWLLAAAAAVFLGWRSREAETGPWLRCMGLFLFTLVVLSPTVMPWYLTWGLPMLGNLVPSVHSFTVIVNLSWLYYLDHRDPRAARIIQHALLALLVALDLVRGRKRKTPGDKLAGGQMTGNGSYSSSRSCTSVR